MSELKSCPFCGGTRIKFQGDSMSCMDCLACGPCPPYDSVETEAEAWNTRTPIKISHKEGHCVELRINGRNYNVPHNRIMDIEND